MSKNNFNSWFGLNLPENEYVDTAFSFLSNLTNRLNDFYESGLLDEYINLYKGNII